MKIEINNSKVINIVEQCLIVKNGRLYNTVKKEYEGLDGDKVTFYVLSRTGAKCWISGTVDGYTCNRRIKLKGADELYSAAEDCMKILSHSSVITDSDYNGVEEVDAVEEDWEVILSA